MKLLTILAFLWFILFSCNSNITLPEEGDSGPIRINQLGYYPQSPKEFVAADVEAESYMIVDTQGKVCFKGELTDKGTWNVSGEKVLMGDFTEFKTPGTYVIYIEPDIVSFPFEIGEEIHLAALNASIKSFYFQRASMPIEEQFGGIYKRASGHPDDACTFHPSTGKEEGILNSPGGWYDAGDYGKYIVNAALSSAQMLNLMEIYPEIVKDGQLGIPESGNGISDLLDLSDKILLKIGSIPYQVGLDHFEWGSNSDVLDQAMILCYAHHLTGDQKYLKGVIQNIDYIFGKNATGFCFLTGFGSKHVMNPHHRPSGADGIEEPVPGFIAGGPNKEKQDRQSVEYSSDYPAKAFQDVQSSYASNEVCLNWNSPAVFVLGYLEQVY